VPTDDDEDDKLQERPWLIQCKREKSIGPTKAEQYAEDILKENKDLYGVLFVVSCDLSKDARDKIRGTLAKAGVQEVRIWTRAELEDQLFQPKNDNLLFAYFGFSLARRKQSEKTKIKSKLVTKKKVQRILGERPHQHVLIRDVEYKDYPVLNEKEFSGIDLPIKDMQVLGYFYDGILLTDNRYHAYLDKEKKEYDVEERYNQIRFTSRDSLFVQETPDAPKNRMAFFGFQQKVPDEKRYLYLRTYAIFYDNIVDIDDQGDEYCSDPHIYVNRLAGGNMYARPKHPSIHKHDNYLGPHYFDDSKYKRISYFPKIYRSKKQPIDQSVPKPAQDERPFPSLNTD
jgi:hypothetical protein